MPKLKKAAKNHAAPLGLEATLWAAADKLRGNLDSGEYKHVVLGLIFLKYIWDAFEERHATLVAQKADGADPEDPDEYRAGRVFWVPRVARWPHLQAKAKDPNIGKLLDDAMTAIEKDNPSLKGVLPREYAKPALDKQRLGELIDIIGTIGLGDAGSRSKDILGRVYEYFLSQFASAEGKKGGEFSRPAAWSSCSSRCWSRSRAASTTPAAARRGCSCSRRSSSRRTAARPATWPSSGRS